MAVWRAPMADGTDPYTPDTDHESAVKKGCGAYIPYWCCTHVQEFDSTAYVQVHAAQLQQP